MQREQKAQNAVAWYTLKSWQHFHTRQHVEKVKKKKKWIMYKERWDENRTKNRKCVKWVCEDDDEDEKENKDCT
jgi:hypothetical protein